MLDLLKNELSKQEVFSTPLPKFLIDFIKTLPSTKINDKMKLLLAVNELILFTSEFRRNIRHYNGSLIPINAISFCLSASGSGKDSSINTLRRNFTSAYSYIQSKRRSLAYNRASSIAESKGLDTSVDANVFKFYEEPMPLFVAPSTNEGFIQYLNDLDDDSLGSGFIFSGEIGSELQTSQTIVQNLQLLSEMYDEGKKEVKVIKDKEKQSREIKNLPVSALFMGSPENILYDDSIKRKFKMEFNTKLARRSFFNYNVNEPIQKEFVSIEDMLKEINKLESDANKYRVKFDEQFLEIAKFHIDKSNADITISNKAKDLVILYKKYCEEIAETIAKQYPITKLSRQHMYWKALKLSGCFAILRCSDEIEPIDYKRAIVFTELLADDIYEFEIELLKEPYELFVSLAKTMVEDTKYFADIHTLKKLGYITGTSNLTTKLKELEILANAYDKDGVYKVTNNGIEYTQIVKTDSIGVSYLECSGSKEERKNKCSNNFTYAQITFKDLADLLKKDYAYCPFEFKQGIRNSSNLIGGCKWIALDIDNSDFSDEQMHEILQNFNHHIARTSDKSNAFKFRILLELDSVIDLDDMAYKSFIRSICEYLGLKADILPKSQIYFSYSDRDILSITNANPIETRVHLLNAMSNKNESISLSTLNKKQKQTLIDNKFETFSFAFEAKDGEGSIALIKCAYYAKDLGMDIDSIIELINEINEYWTYPMEQDRLENTILKQIRKWSA